MYLPGLVIVTAVKIGMRPLAACAAKLAAATIRVGTINDALMQPPSGQVLDRQRPLAAGFTAVLENYFVTGSVEVSSS
jgi:hypothetical protein